MLNKQQFDQKVQQLREEVLSLNGIDDAHLISETAQRLKGLNYAPPVGISRDAFLSCTTGALISEIDRLASLPDSAAQAEPESGDGPLDVKLQRISVLVFYFRELAQLRRGVPEAWDEVDELYVHD